MQIEALLHRRDTEWVSGNIFVRENPGLKGEVVEGHTHRFDHTTIIFIGSILVKRTTPDGQISEQVFRAPSHLLIKAEDLHDITFLEDGIFWCVYAHRDPQGRVSQEWTGWYEAYL